MFTLASPDSRRVLVYNGASLDLLVTRLVLTPGYSAAPQIVLELIHLAIRLNFVSGSCSENSGGRATLTSCRELHSRESSTSVCAFSIALFTNVDHAHSKKNAIVESNSQKQNSPILTQEIVPKQRRFSQIVANLGQRIPRIEPHLRFTRRGFLVQAGWYRDCSLVIWPSRQPASGARNAVIINQTGL